jgi:heme/copper-type cytochrome/quinol oxidase subunit 1
MTVVRRFGIPILGVIFAVAGAIVGLVRLLNPDPVSFGWTAYAPLSSEVYSPSIWDAVWLSVSGEIALAVGLVLIAGWIGCRLGRRPSAKASA